MIVITLSKVPTSLRGDLTKWCQEIQTGVYVGNVNVKIRELLWSRILENIGNGEATIVWNARNEIGYDFKTTRKDHKVVDFDGIPLMMSIQSENLAVPYGFSLAAKRQKARKFTHLAVTGKKRANFVSIDLETTGLYPANSDIISIGAVKSEKRDTFYKLIKIQTSIPDKIVKLTGISNSVLQEKGENLDTVLEEFATFVGEEPLVGYNIAFDSNFLDDAFHKTGRDALKNRFIDLLPIIKKKDIFLANYHLETVLQNYGIENQQPHNALSDARATMALAEKMIDMGYLRI
ncbi:type I-E CRISPR-associated endoribonuclease Cas2e [Lactobacillus corticis]|uniref:DNA polymerase III polC-type n=1 Tax=Lactobacillus corticis TaxID=2201249 RepID=A0A916VIP7_9LACO|nr:type I-E CRISPR-associated endoribonuclease Cas2e [Lactobacillus corticis]GFZ26129.1 CRISPR-associated protein Cas2 [Lactobacillus corticis]